MKIALLILLVLAVGFLGIAFLGWIFSGPVYKGPGSDHFNGKKFISPWGIQAKGFKDMMKWVRNRQPGYWKEMMDLPAGPKPAARVDGDSLVVTFVNHSTFLIQTMGLNILTDPIWAERASPVSFAGPKRMRPPGIRLEDLPKIDIILLSHNHYDHLDIGTMQRLCKEHGPAVFCPLGVGLYLEKKGIGNITEMDWWDQVAFNADVSVLCTPAQHFSGRGMFDRDKTLWAGFALMTGSGNIYYSGDTGYGNFFWEIAEKVAPLRLAFLPIGAFKPEWFMSPIHTSPADALKIHHEINSPVSIGMHFGTFPLADDGMDDPEQGLRSLMKEKGIPGDEFLVLEEGIPKMIKNEMTSQKLD
jgi:L-ascorbate metabolism protein UlaG (beta-lactamase superfamily)